MTWNAKRFFNTNKEVVVILVILVTIFILQKRAGFNAECLIPAYCAIVSPEATEATSNITNAITKLNESITETISNNTTKTQSNLTIGNTMTINAQGANFIGCGPLESNQTIDAQIEVIQEVNADQSIDITNATQDAIDTFIDDVNTTTNGFAATGNLGDLFSSDQNTTTTITNTTDLKNITKNLTSMTSLNAIITTVQLSNDLVANISYTNFVCGKDAAGNALSPAEFNQNINLSLISSQVTDNIVKAIADNSNATEISNTLTKMVEEKNEGVGDAASKVIDSAGDAVAKNNPFVIWGTVGAIVAVVIVIAIVMMSK